MLTLFMDLKTAMASRPGFIFLSHAGVDTNAAKQFAEVLRRNGLDVWFDKDDLLPGERWMEALESAIRSASAMIVYIGRLAVQAWVDREVRFGLVRNTENPISFRLIPVLGEGADVAALPPFLQQHQCVDLRDPQRAPAEIKRLVDGLQGAAAERSIRAEYWATHSPFRGLEVFQPEDSWLFFGRDADTDQLLNRLACQAVVAILGNSGSGKSSLLRAGLIPALRRGRFRIGGNTVDSWRIAVFRPSSAPFDELAETVPRQLAPELGPTGLQPIMEDWRNRVSAGGSALRSAIIAMAGSRPEGNRVLLVADQFEEIFTITESLEIRRKYIETLLATARTDGSVPIHVVLSLRADFYANCLDYPVLSRALEANLHNLSLISPPQIRDNIEKRLALAGASAEVGLLDSLLADAGTEPGNLALLEHALGELWRDQGITSHALTSDGYTKIGRMRGALTRRAESVFNALSDLDKERARQIFLELVQLGQGAPDTRRRATKEELLGLSKPEDVEVLLGRLTSERLISTSAGEGNTKSVVEVSHEALIREWPRLREWIRQNREDLHLKRRLQQNVEAWEAVKRDTSELLRGVGLATAEDWLSRNPNSPALLKEFIEESARERSKAAQNEMDARERELTREQELRREAEGRATAELALRTKAQREATRFRWFLAVAAALALVAVGALWLAQKRQRAAQEQLAQNYWQNSRSAQAVAENLEALHFVAEAIRLSPWLRETLLLDIRAIQPFPLKEMVVHQGVWGAQFSHDESRILTWSSDHTARLWDARSGKQIGPALQHQDAVLGAQFSHDESRILTWSSDHTARLWDVRTGQQISPAFQHDGPVRGARFSGDESRVLTWSDDSTARLWDLRTGRQIGPAFRHNVWGVTGAQFSRDESRILTWGVDETARLWDVRTGQQIGPALQHQNSVEGAQFSRDESRVLTWSYHSTARLWDVRTGRQIGPAFGHQNGIDGAQLSRDESRILTWGDDNTARLWDTRTGQQIGPALQHDGPVRGAQFSRDETRILTWSYDNTARLWDARSGQQIGPALQHGSRVNGAQFSNDASRILTWSLDQTARLWDASTGQQIGPALQHQGEVYGARFNRDETRILSWSGDQTVRLWDTRQGQQMGPVFPHQGRVYGARFSRDESRVLTWSTDNAARLWDARSGKQIGPPLQHRGKVWGAQFSRDESRILTWSEDNTARLWDTRTGQQIGPALQHQGAVRDAQFNRDESRILTSSKDNTARLWDVRTGQQIGPALQHQGEVYGARFSRDESRILTWSEDNTARLWDTRTGQQIGPALQHQGTVRDAQFNHDESRILTSSKDNTARLWDARTGQQIGPALQHQGEVYGARFSRNENRILTWGGNTARLWDARTGKQIAAFQQLSAVWGAQFSRDESRILTWGGNTARLWNARTGQQIGPAFQHRDVVWGAQFSRDESRILTWSNDQTAQLWDTSSGQALGPPLQHQNSVEGAQFSRDESRILAWGGDMARVWLLNTDLDFPVEFISLWIQAATGSEYDFVTRQVRTLNPERWHLIRERYEQIAADHAKTCKYRDVNQWLRLQREPGR